MSSLPGRARSPETAPTSGAAKRRTAATASSPWCVAAVVFDLDGTLVDSLDDIAASARYAFAVVGRPPPERAAVRAAVGDGARVLLARLAGTAPDQPLVEALLGAFLEHYAAHPADHAQLMPGAAATLDALAPLPLALCTNKPRRSTEGLLRQMGLEGRFAAVACGDDLPTRKPDPAPLRWVCERLGVAPGAVAMVGDGPQDVECGRRAGALTVGVLGGFAAEEQLRAARPEHLIASLAALPAALVGPHAGAP